jgi:hypothetical protein
MCISLCSFTYNIGGIMITRSLSENQGIYVLNANDDVMTKTQHNIRRWTRRVPLDE